MEELPVVDQEGDSKKCWNWKTVFAGQVCVACSVKDDSEGRGEKKQLNNKPGVA